MSLWQTFCRHSRSLGLGVAALVLVSDQLTKHLVVNGLMADGPRVIELAPVLNLVMAWNPGVSFGLFGGGSVGPWVFLLFSSALALGLAVWLWRVPVPLLRLGLALMIGGALGNGIDRVHWGAVADFIDVHAFGWHFWAFNIADAGISVGAALLVADSLFRRSS